MAARNANDTCEEAWSGEEALFEDFLTGYLVFHHLALILSAVFMCLACTVSLWLILDHARHYLKPSEQKHIIRILGIIPIYTVFSFLSVLFNAEAPTLELIRNCYEACVLASFFTLLSHYVAPNLHEQKEYFRSIRPKLWMFPLNKVTPPRSGLTWFNIIYVGIFQFCLTRPLLALSAVIAETQKRYCSSLLEPYHAHIWIAILQGGFVLTAMYCLAQFYKQVKVDLACHGPFLKFLCIKLTLFLCFWQTWFLGLLARKSGPLKPTATLAALDIHVSIPHLLVCFEMTTFACTSHFAFPWRAYEIDSHFHGAKTYTGTPAQALLDAINPWDYAKAAARGLRWLFRGVRHRKSDPSYQRDFNNEQHADGKIDIEWDIPAVNRGRSSARSDPGHTGDLARRIEKTVNLSMDRHTVG